MNAILEAPAERSVPAEPTQSVLSATVMVVDDNPANLKLMQDMLRLQGYRVRSFPRGRMAIAAAHEQSPDLILLDIDMPEMTGYEVCERLKSNPLLAGIPVIFLSAMNATEDRVNGFRLGAVDFISKPFQFEEVHARVAAHIKLRHMQQQSDTDNGRLNTLVQDQVKQIADAQMATIFALAKLAEARDDETGKHLERVQTFCKLLARQLGTSGKYKSSIDNTYVNNIFHASPLHDIGKVSIPDHILLKPGRLTTEEFEIMKTHAALGSHTLRSVSDRYPDNAFINMGIDIAQSHHERWDGRGYPEGLRGAESPLCARILSVADCYDAIRSKRCYKAAVPHDKTCVIIAEAGGTQFDPDVILAFNELTEEFDGVWTSMTTEIAQ